MASNQQRLLYFVNFIAVKSACLMIIRFFFSTSHFSTSSWQLFAQNNNKNKIKLKKTLKRRRLQPIKAGWRKGLKRAESVIMTAGRSTAADSRIRHRRSQPHLFCPIFLGARGDLMKISRVIHLRGDRPSCNRLNLKKGLFPLCPISPPPSRCCAPGCCHHITLSSRARGQRG